MRIYRRQRQKQFSLLLAVFLLLCNVMVTAHAFGDVDHAVKDGCQICHQFEQQSAPAGVQAPLADIRRHTPPPVRLHVEAAAVARRYFQARAPPLA